MKCEVCILILLLIVFAKLGVPSLGRFAFQLITKLGVLLLKKVCYLQLLLCWKFPAGTGLFVQLLARFWYSVAWVTILCNQFGCLAALITIA